MSEEMNLTLNGHSKVPPGFRFHPTEEELLQYYLRKKVASEKIDLDVIREVDLNILEPWEIQEKCEIGSTPQNDWYFFSHKDKKYPTGCRTNRATASGFWKATGRDKVIHSNSGRIGMRKTLVFYRGRAPHGQKSDWIMHEYRLDDHTCDSTNASNMVSGSGLEEGWVVCRVFKKKKYHKALDSQSNSSNLPRNEVVLDQILKCMGRTSSCKQEENESNTLFANQPTPFLHFPQHEGRPTMNPSPSISLDWATVNDPMTEIGPPSGPTTDWATLDRLVASQLNGQPSKQYSCYGEDFSFSFDHEIQDVISSDTGLWNFESCLYCPVEYNPTR